MEGVHSLCKFLLPGDFKQTLWSLVPHHHHHHHHHQQQQQQHLFKSHQTLQSLGANKSDIATLKKAQIPFLDSKIHPPQ